MILVVVIVWIIVGMGKVILEFSFSFLVLKVIFCRNVDFEIKIMNFLILFMFRRYWNNFFGIYVLLLFIFFVCCLVFCICCLEMLGICCWSFVWLYLLYISESIWICVDLFLDLCVVIIVFILVLSIKVFVGFLCDKWYLIIDGYRGFFCEGVIVFKIRVIVFFIFFMYCLFVFLDVLF